MLKKARAGLAGKEEGATKDLSKSVLDSSRQIWLAGLGAFFARAKSKRQKVFEGLVKQGEVWTQDAPCRAGHRGRRTSAWPRRR
jgi:hypothetical protein